MGLEATCAAKLGDAESRGKALLETSELVFRGDFRVRVPFGEVTGLAVDGERLVVRFGAQSLALALGSAAAARWADKIRNPPSRLDKLGVKPSSRVAAVGAFAADFVDELGARAAELARGTPRAPVDILFLAAESRAELGRLESLRARIVPDGAIWIVRPKGQAGAIGEADVRAAARAAGLVDVKVAAFSATHTADKYVIPAAQRGATRATATAKNPPPRPSRKPSPRTRPPKAPARGRRG
jgi:hypothetical protein